MGERQKNNYFDLAWYITARTVTAKLCFKSSSFPHLLLLKKVFSNVVLL